jgi:hypothetical protein
MQRCVEGFNSGVKGLMYRANCLISTAPHCPSVNIMLEYTGACHIHILTSEVSTCHSHILTSEVRPQTTSFHIRYLFLGSTAL